MMPEYGERFRRVGRVTPTASPDRVSTQPAAEAQTINWRHSVECERSGLK